MTDAETSKNARTRILEVATHLFAQRGYGSTSVREVVEASGVTKPTLYYYFESKEALFLEVVKFHMDQLTGLVEQALAAPGDVRTRLTGLVDCYVRGAVDNPDVVLLMATAQRRTGDGQPDVEIMNLHLRKMSLLDVLFREGVDRGELRADLDVHHAVLAFIGVINLHCIACVHGMPVVDGFADRILDLFYRGVRS
jgi:AcrR family transcriptional regulator